MYAIRSYYEKEFGGKDKDTNMAMDNDGYAAFDVPWSLSVNYSFRLIKDKFNKENIVITSYSIHYTKLYECDWYSFP